MKVVVIGAGGFLGRRVSSLLLERGADLWSVDREPLSGQLSGESSITLDVTDAGAAESVASHCGPVDAVVWLAASIRQVTGIDSTAVEDVEVMVEAPLRLLHSLPSPPGSLIYLSSIQVYGAPRCLPVGEDHAADPFTAYGVAKLLGEQYLKIACGKLGVPIASLRLAFMYGPGQHAGNVIPRFLSALKGGQAPAVFGTGDEIRDDIYVDDVAHAVAMAMEARADGSFNIASGSPHTLRDVAEAVCRLGETGLQPRFEGSESSWIDRSYTVDRARESFGFEATTSLDEGLERMWKQMESA